MTLLEIKTAIDNGKIVYWNNPSYIIKKDKIGQWFIFSQFTNSYIGLTHMDNITLNGREEEFYIR